ncbi:SPOR domain-containing protein [Luteimonas kalidii]|uniref:SPOR domain-containing protein n=1 Tax=Luteimonas kalidii TaxID=3042025 RepID=A0ABT6JPZ6_9GAMM|nr:SPOR domain-containing protein [Luteimonas kalidii]MDH5832750.1 SPOR domain-containing protein [Luteimonas kalidii]
MAAKRGRSQATRNGGNGLPGWAWMILGIVIALVAVLVLPRYLKSERTDGFFRPQPDAGAQPAVSAIDGDDVPPPDEDAPAATVGPGAEPAPASPDYDFYTVLPEQEVALTDAELAASAREEAERQRRTLAAQRQREQDAADLASQAPTTPATTPAATAPSAAASAAAAADGARYILQAGSFSASGDAEALKARIALLGLSARVESGSANGKTVYRVRMGPYGTATELAQAKQKLGNGGLPALAIKAN